MHPTCIPELIGFSPEQEALLNDLLEREGLESRAQSATIRRRDAKTAPLSFGQQRLWFLDRWQTGTALYNLPLALRLQGPLNLPALQQALDVLVARHASMRTIFPIQNGQPLQVLLEPQPVLLPLVEIPRGPDTMRNDDERLAEGERESDSGAAVSLTAFLEEEARRPFDLARGPLFRARLVRSSPRDHVLLLNMHHIVSDAWSLDLLFNEWTALYDAFAQGERIEWPELPIQYGDFAAWQRDWLNGEALEQQLSYWKKQLANPSAGLNLPTDHPRPAAPSARGAVQSAALPLRLSEALQGVGQREQASLFMVLLAGFATLLHRYSGQDDICLGSPFSSRTCVETEGLVGFFVNTLALRVNLSGRPTFAQLLARVREAVLGASAHQDVPFERVVEEVHPARSTNQNPLFQVMFSHQRAPECVRQTGGLMVTALDLHTRVAKFDLTLNVVERERQLKAVLEYDTELFEAGTAARLLMHYETLLQAIAANPDARLLELPLLGEDERNHLVREWNETESAYPENQGLHELLEEQALRTPDALAVICGEQRLTYRELNERAGRLASSLRKRGVGPEVVVGLFLDRSVEMLVGLLAVLKAGGAYLPLDLRFPRERLAHMLGDARPKVLLTRRKWLPGLPGHAAEVLCFEDWNEASLRPAGLAQTTNVQQNHRLDVESWTLNVECSGRFRGRVKTAREGLVPAESQGRFHPDHLAYVIYTSGSTGRPKGVEISHRAVVNFLSSMRRLLNLEAADVLLAVTPLSFDIAGLELFLPLLVGARVVIAEDAAVADGAQLARMMNGTGVTAMQATPATWRLLLQSGWAGHPGLKILCGGEAWRRDLAEPLLGRCGSLWNLYGPTETTIWSSAAQVGAGEEMVSLGRPLANTQIYLLDRSGQPVPLGVPGELCIGGLGVARGYRNRPDLTAERFVPDPFARKPGLRLYRTGDLARYRPDGSLEFLGRVDHQVKLRGFRIELGEIESALSEFNAVRECVVLAREDTAGESRLVAYVVTRPDQPATGKGLHEFLKRKLPQYMVPTAFVFLEQLPRTANGKVDRLALPAAASTHAVRQKRFIAPRTEAERVVAAIFGELLGLDRVGIHDHFFELGGHSLLAAQVISRLGETWNVEMPVRVIFEAPTVAELAHAAAQCQTARAEGDGEIRRQSRRQHAQTLLARMDRLSDAEVEALLDQELKQNANS